MTRLLRARARWVILFAVVALLAAALSSQAVTVTVTRQAPLENLSATGDVTGVTEAQMGTPYTLVAFANGQVTVHDAQGATFRLPVSATDYVPPVAATSPSTAQATPSASTNAVPSASATVTSAPAPVPARVSPVSSTPVDGAAGVATVNAALGKPLFGDGPLWQDTALMVAQRMGLGLEGRTQWEASYRRYFSGQPDDPKAAMLGTGAYCVALYADADDHPTSVLIAFANDGDFRGIGHVAADIKSMAYQLFADPGHGDAALRLQYASAMAEMQTTFEPYRQKQQVLLLSRLTRLLGDPRQTAFGGDTDTSEKSLRWDWNGASFLLTCQPGKYNLLRIVPTELADNDGRTARISRDDIGHRLSGAVIHRDNGDVVITQIPMADQGPKGYCVPATWERVLRYTGVPGDMYTLSRIGDAGFGGGENGLQVATELDKTLDHYGRHMEVLEPTRLDYIAIRHYIDDGIPIFWAVNPNGYDAALQRYSLCDRDKDFDTWKKLLDQARATPDISPLAPDQGHQVLIIGYNPDTKEIAWTDPWGRDTRERWMTQEEALRCTLGQYYIITW